MKTKDDLRKVLLTDSDNSIDYKIKGVFHEWGQFLMETRSDPEGYINEVPITLGIVEIEDSGQIWKVDPNRIKFV